jgi:hypothetical protein
MQKKNSSAVAGIQTQDMLQINSRTTKKWKYSPIKIVKQWVMPIYRRPCAKL